MRRIVTCNEKIPVKPYLRIFLRGMFRSWVISVILVGKIKPFCISESTVDTRARTAPGHEATWCAMAATRDQPRGTQPPSTSFTQNKGVPPICLGTAQIRGDPRAPHPDAGCTPNPQGAARPSPSRMVAMSAMLAGPPWGRRCLSSPPAAGVLRPKGALTLFLISPPCSVTGRVWAAP